MKVKNVSYEVENVTNIHAENKEGSIHLNIPKCWETHLSMKKLKVDVEKEVSNVCIMKGIIYNKDDMCAKVSCGGLINTFPLSMLSNYKIGETVQIGLS